MATLYCLYLSVLLVLAGIAGVCGYLATTASAGPYRGKMRLIAGMALGVGLLVYGSVNILSPELPSVEEAKGIIQSLTVIDTNQRHYSALLQIVTINGGEVPVRVYVPSPAWKENQRLEVRYDRETDDLIRATIFDANWRPMGVIRGEQWTKGIFALLFGVLSVGITWNKYRYDPEGMTEIDTERTNRWNTPDDVDEKSLLHLSSSATEREERYTAATQYVEPFTSVDEGSLLHLSSPGKPEDVK